MPAGLLRAHAQDAVVGRVWGREGAVDGGQHPVRRGLGHHRRDRGQPVLPGQDAATELLAAAAGGHATHLQKCMGRAEADLRQGGRGWSVPGRGRGGDQDGLWQLGAVADVLLCEEAVDEARGYGGGPGFAFDQQCYQRCRRVCCDAPAW